MTKNVYEAMVKKLTENNFTVKNFIRVYPSWYKKNIDPAIKDWCSPGPCLCYWYDVTNITFNGEYMTITWKDNFNNNGKYINGKTYTHVMTIHRKYLINMI